MRERRVIGLPEGFAITYVSLLAIGVVVGALVGLGAISPVSFVAIVGAVLTMFVPWAVLHLDPRGLAGQKSYRGDPE
ncbi:MAG TPA: hypothetical protein VFZ41_00250 [Solirubrobacterales bacterium]